MSYCYGNTLLVANPASQNGRGDQAAQKAKALIEAQWNLDCFEVVLTERQGHAVELARQSERFDTIIALGGDGLVHEIANGLMQLHENERPSLALLPFGTGNDYARTLHMSPDLDTSIQQLKHVKERKIDIGKCNEEYFVESLSFGLDAAIALDTVERRQRTGKTGTRVFFESGIDMLLHNMNTYSYNVSYDDNQQIVQGDMLLFAIQIGKTYGGGFIICPEAQCDDGIFDVCIAHPPLGIPKAVMMFLLAKNAHHTKFKELEFTQARKVSLSFSGNPPGQIDGESFSADSYHVECIPQAFKVLFPQ